MDIPFLQEYLPYVHSYYAIVDYHVREVSISYVTRAPDARIKCTVTGGWRGPHRGGADPSTGEGAQWVAAVGAECTGGAPCGRQSSG